MRGGWLVFWAVFEFAMMCLHARGERHGWALLFAGFTLVFALAWAFEERAHERG